MTDIKIFESEEFGQLRSVLRDGEPWFVAADVCRVLEIGNPSQALSRLDEDERFTTLISNEGAASGKSSMAFVNEPGLYSLVLGSRKPEAKAFKRWITHEVIPSIRKTGQYQAKPKSALELFAQSVAAMQEMEKKQQVLEDRQSVVEKRLDNIGDIVTLNPNSWRKECAAIIAKIAEKMGGFGFIPNVNAEIYKLMLERFGIDLKRRLTNKRLRAADDGVCRSKRDKMSYLDVIADDKRAIESYVQLVKEMAIKYGVDKPADIVTV